MTPLPTNEASAWLRQHLTGLPAGAHVLDVAAGYGRNTRWLAAQDFRVEAVDIDATACIGLSKLANVEALCADLESDPWPYGVDLFDAVVVCRYLHRPLFPSLLSSIKPGGLLIYETFMRGQELLRRPQNPDFLLEPDELRQVVTPGFEVLAFEQGLFKQQTPAMMQRICARKQAS